MRTLRLYYLWRAGPTSDQLRSVAALLRAFPDSQIVPRNEPLRGPPVRD